MNGPLLKDLVIKPTLRCTASCPTCLHRRELHQSVSKKKRLSFEQWLDIFIQADKLGTSCLTISGGEPTLYKKLPELIRAGKALGWYVKMNTNGSLLTRELAVRLLDEGLDAVDISIYSPNADIHDHMRGTPGLWRKAVKALRLLVKLREKYPGFLVISQSILTQQNYMQFDQLLNMHLDNGIDGFLISYLEGDYEGRQLLDPNDIHVFRKEILPKMIEHSSRLPLFTRQIVRSRLSRIFSPDILGVNEWSQGKYTHEGVNCCIPNDQALILANGDIHPCNIVEYIHKPIAGNLFKSSLADIWKGRIWRTFRETKHDFCIQCPMNLHTYLSLRPKDLTSKILQTILPLVMGSGQRSLILQKTISRQIQGIKKAWRSR